PLPVPLSTALGTMRGSALFLVGIVSDGTSRMFELSSVEGRESWITHAGWLGEGIPTSLVIQNSALYLTVHGSQRTADRLLRSSPARHSGLDHCHRLSGCDAERGVLLLQARKTRLHGGFFRRQPLHPLLGSGCQSVRG